MRIGPIKDKFGQAAEPVFSVQPMRPKRKKRRSLRLAVPVFVFGLAVYFLETAALGFLIYERIGLERKLLINEGRIRELEKRLETFRSVQELSSGFNEEEKIKIAQAVWNWSQNLEVSPLWIAALIMTESSFKKGAVSHMGAVGLMQVKPSVAFGIILRQRLSWDALERLHEPETNINLAGYYLWELGRRFKEIDATLTAYNYGEEQVARWITAGVPLPADFSGKVKAHYRRLALRYPVLAAEG
ncbi:MAG TPA: transglycosylase SLT domain-containing protein [candidate division Zixibacteria bacterium]|nr:transglycosylase SLT domain-containing protein [candidate division Zixibacteria bacterium]